MRLSSPRQLTFLISLILIIVGIVTFFVRDISFFDNQAFWLTFAGGALLSLGCLIKGL
ncbi:MAG: hypothetical protein LBV20_05385 [Treponema sp.]|jgi:hypothetical protein|nr:hypothetical protein [Treponema sp.]